MPRTTFAFLIPALAAAFLFACGTDDSKSAASAPPAKPSPTAPKSETAPAAAPKAADAGHADAKTAMKPGDTHASDASGKDKSEPAAGTTPAAPADPMTTMRDFIASKKIDKTAPNWRTSVPMPPKLTFDAKHTYYWLLNTTEGPIKIRLMPDVAPMHVSSTIYLTELGFYDGLTFHRVIPGFMAQGGDPLGTGQGGPAYKYAVETSPKASHSKAGILSMANAGPGTEGSQFFITFAPQTRLDGSYSVFGEVTEGLDNLMKMEKSGSPSGQTTKTLKIDSAKIIVE